MFLAALFTVAKIQKQPKCPSTDAWTKKMWHVYTMEYYYSAIKKEWQFTCNNMEGIMLTEKDKYCMLLLTCGIFKIKQMSEYNKKEIDSQI